MSTSVAPATQIMLQEALDASIVIGTWDYDVVNDRVYANALVALVFNIAPRLAESGVPLRTFIASIHPDDRKHTALMIKQRTQTRGFRVIEYRVRSADGVTRWIIDRCRFELDQAGRPQRGSGILIDATDSRQVAEHAVAPDHPEHPIERAAEHCLAAHEAIRELPEPLLQTMCDMLLLEIGHRLSAVVPGRRFAGLN